MNVFFAAAVPPPLALGWTDGLSGEKRARIERMRRTEDRALALTAHRLLCCALKKVFDIMPAPGDFALYARGKPYLKGRPDVHFSISHSGAMAMCAVHDKPVGADIERIRPVGAGVAARVMSSAEREAYMQAPDKESLFFEIWTLKEAYIKYCGEGLGLPLNSVTIYPSEDGIVTDTGCAFWLLGHNPGYQAAVCARDESPPSVQVVSTDQLMLMTC